VAILYTENNLLRKMNTFMIIKMLLSG